MICLAYYSSATTLMAPSELQAILAQSQRNNAAHGVTGMLCHYDGSFLQFLEGDEAAVAATFARIERDPRHRGLLEVYRQPLDVRAFGEWTMAIVHPNDMGPTLQAFCRSLHQVEVAATVAHRRTLQPLLESFQSWAR
jgi:hypothetical protein